MSPTSPRRPHWLALTDRTALLAAVTAYLPSLPDLHPDRFTLTEVLSELGVAAARAHLDRVPAARLRAAAGIPADACQVRLSTGELEALRSVPGLPQGVALALGLCATNVPDAREFAGGREATWSS